MPIRQAGMAAVAHNNPFSRSVGAGEGLREEGTLASPSFCSSNAPPLGRRKRPLLPSTLPPPLRNPPAPENAPPLGRRKRPLLPSTPPPPLRNPPAPESSTRQNPTIQIAAARVATAIKGSTQMPRPTNRPMPAHRHISSLFDAPACQRRVNWNTERSRKSVSTKVSI